MQSRSLRRQLPLWIAMVLMVTVLVTAWASYYELHRAILATVAERLEVAAKEVGTLLDGSLARPRAEVTQLAKDPALVAVLVNETPAAREAALAALRKARPAAAGGSALALWTTNGHLIVSDGPEFLANAARPSNASAAVDSATVGSLISVDSSFAYSIAAPVLVRGQAIGILVRAQRNAAGGGAGAALIARLVGQNSRVLMGNVEGDLWTDFSRVVPAPATVTPGVAVEFADSAGGTVIGSATPIDGTPWQIWIGLPQEASSMDAVRSFRARGLLIAAILTLFGALAAWIVVRRVARDVASEQLTSRAELLQSKNAELRQSELRFRQLVDHSPDAIIVHRYGRIIFANMVAARVLGVPAPDDLVGRPIRDFVAETEREDAERLLGIGAGPNKPTPLAEGHLIRADRTEITVEATAMGVTLDGEPAVQAIIRDVTQRRLLEDQFRQSQKMEAVGRLAGGIAHDFNNLLTVIHTYADILMASTPPEDPRHADLAEILHASKSAAGLTRQMLAFSRKQVLDPRRLDLNEATTSVIAMIKRIIGDHIEVSTTLRTGVNPIWADGGQIEQVLINLAVNARDAMPEGGLLRIETANARLDSGYASYHGQAIPAGDYVLLSVTDTGIGMTEEIQRQIFEPFFTTKDAGSGTGLGLSTVYGIVKQSEGYIWVYSEPGQGTAFKIYFPRYAGEEEPAVLPIPDRPLRADRLATVLLVEDEPHVRAAVKRVLESRNVRVVEADRPSAAIAIFEDKTRTIDLVITDMMMPEMTGADLVRELTTRRANLRAIIMSGYSEEATSRQWRLPPNALFIEKPIEPAELFRRMHEAFGWHD
jgi:PAS domain S-box-containing protein